MQIWKDNLVKLIADRETNPHQLSIDIGKSNSYVAVLLSGNSEPSIDTFVKIAKVLNVPVNVLYDGELSADEQKIMLNLFSRMSVENRRITMEFIKTIEKIR